MVTDNNHNNNNNNIDNNQPVPPLKYPIASDNGLEFERKQDSRALPLNIKVFDNGNSYGNSRNNSNRQYSRDFEVKNIQISGLPVEVLRVRIENEDGLKQLAYEIDNENMTEVLAGLRYRFGPPVGTSVDVEGGSPQQQWIWHTGEDVIVAVKSEHRPFVLSYRPSLLDPSFL